MTRLLLLTAGLAILGLAGCDKPKDRHPPPEPAPPYADRAPPEQLRERAGPVRWNADAGAFEMDGKPLKAARLWTFDNSSDGFTGSGVRLDLEPGGGLHVANLNGDPALLSPKGLAVPGGRYPMVVVRLTRVAAAPNWKGHLFFFTAQHQASEQFRGKPRDPAGPAAGETVTLVYDMAQSDRGGADWAASEIDQIRLDTDDAPGGEFVVRQIAIVAPPPAPPQATAAAPVASGAPGAP